MKFQIVLFVLAAIVLCSSSENIKGRFRNIRTEQVLRNQKDNPPIGRSFYNKNNGNQASVIVIGIPTGGPEYYYPDDEYDEEEEMIDGTFDVTLENQRRADNDVDFLDSEDEVDNEQTLIKRTKGNSLRKLKNVNGKKEVRRLKASSKTKTKTRFEKSALLSSSATSKNGGNKLQMFRLNGSNKVNRNSGNVALRRLFIKQ